MPSGIRAAELAPILRDALHRDDAARSDETDKIALRGTHFEGFQE